MGDLEIFELISKSLDEELSEFEKTKLDKALKESATLRDLLSDLKLLHQAATSDVPEPSAGLQFRTEHAVKQRYSRVKIFYNPLLSTRWTAMAVSFVLIAIIALPYLFDPDGLSYGGPEVTVQEYSIDQAIVNVAETQRNFREAIAALEVIADQKLLLMPEMLSSFYYENLTLVDRAIYAHEELLPENGSNFLLYKSLLRTYQSKVELLTIVINS